MSDIEAISQLVLRERSARGRHLDDELANSYWDDATVTTSWSTGLAKDTFVGKHPVDFDYSLPIVGRFGTPIVHLNGNRAYVELSSSTKHWMYLDKNEVVVESFMTLVYRVEKRDGVWKISDMSAICEADTLTPVLRVLIYTLTATCWTNCVLHTNSWHTRGLSPAVRLTTTVLVLISLRRLSQFTTALKPGLSKLSRQS